MANGYYDNGSTFTFISGDSLKAGQLFVGNGGTAFNWSETIFGPVKSNPSFSYGFARPLHNAAACSDDNCATCWAEDPSEAVVVGADWGEDLAHGKPPKHFKWFKTR